MSFVICFPVGLGVCVNWTARWKNPVNAQLRALSDSTLLASRVKATTVFVTLAGGGFDVCSRWLSGFSERFGGFPNQTMLLRVCGFAAGQLHLGNGCRRQIVIAFAAGQTLLEMDVLFRFCSDPTVVIDGMGRTPHISLLYYFDYG
jgi:hypothetical protein